MASPMRPAVAAVMRTLIDAPYRFDFFQAVRWLENRSADLPRVGESPRPREDAVRFHQNVSLSFPPSSLHGCREQTDGEGTSLDLWVNFLGLLGPGGPLPLSVTEYVYDRLQNNDDPTLAVFLDIFNHRMISLFYRAWARCQQTVSHDRREDDWYADYVGSFVGIGSRPFHGRDAVSDELKLHYSGRLSCQTRNAEGLQAILEDFFGLPVVIEEFVGRWIHLTPEDRSRLGGCTANSALGVTSIVGSRFWECQHKFRIRMGPMGYAQYEALLPGGKGLRELTAWVRFYVGDELGWETQFVLDRREVPAVSLGRSGRLGWSCWLSARPPQKDPDDLVLVQEGA
ncbi:MAG: type VI secretion system baseplate subunit TssG [Phycisphaerales bacterium]